MRLSKVLFYILLSIVLVVACGNSFVKVEKNKLTLNQKPFYLSGTNQYYLFYKDHKMVDDVIEDAKALNLNVIRAWAFCENSMHDGFCFQPSPRVYDEATFKNLDYVIYKAGKEGIKLNLVLSNNWSDFGGVDQYLKWAGVWDHDEFFRNETIKGIYRDYITYVLNRVNSITGIAYKNDPAIIMWDLMNEPRCNDRAALYAWVDEMAGYIKSIDKNHLVTTGSEGQMASDFIETHKSKNIDVASFHLYPESWGYSEQQADDYIKYHALAAKNSLNKPVFLGEFGLRDRQKRNETYIRWYTLAEDYKLNGMLFWILSGRQSDGSLYPDYDGFTVWCPESGDICETIKYFSTSH